MRILVTGHKSGLGKYLFENFPDAIGQDRETREEEKEKIKEDEVDVIIHCAFNSSWDVTSESLFSYIQDNVFLTRELTSIPHKKFVFVSSVDVYPRGKQTHSEDEIIDVNAVEGIYAMTKLISESMVKEYGKQYLIFRSSAFLGPYSRKNSLKKVMEDENPVVTLTPESEFNYVLYSDVLKFLQEAIEKNLKGVYNIASSENMKLSDIANMFQKKVTFGAYQYMVGNIDNTKAVSVFPAFRKTSQEVIKEFANI